MDFDYKGYTEKEISDICYKNVESLPYKNPFLCTEIYSLGAIIRKFAFFPSFLPFFVCYDHGYTAYKEALEEQKEDCKTRFVFAKWRENVYKPFYKHVKTILFPFIFYRKQKKIKQAKNPKGTLIFAAHDFNMPTTKYCEAVQYNKNIVQEYITKIKNLPVEFQPACVCLHMNDIRYTEIHKYYLEAGIPVYTAGSPEDIRYVKRFYNILKNFKYTMAPAIGSATLYSLDLGIPFILLKNNETETINYSETEKLFYTDNLDKVPQITPEQRKFFEENSGYNDSISRLECAKIVWGSYLKYKFSLFFKMTNKSFWKSFFDALFL